MAEMLPRKKKLRNALLLVVKTGNYYKIPKANREARATSRSILNQDNNTDEFPREQSVDAAIVK